MISIAAIDRARPDLLALWQTPVGLTAREGARNTLITFAALALLALLVALAIWWGLRWLRHHSPR